MDVVDQPDDTRTPAKSLFVQRTPSPALDGLVTRIVGYEERGAGLSGSREIASLTVPLIISFADPFRMAFDADPAEGDENHSFAAGLHPGYVSIQSPGHAACVQIDFTPLGARLFHGVAMSVLASRIVPLDDLGDRALPELRERLADAPSWSERLSIAEAAVRRRLAGRVPGRETLFAYDAIAQSRGTVRTGALARKLGWSRKRIVAHFREEIGIAPKTLARIVRFDHAVRVAKAATVPDWADIASACGYADQAHMTREFVEFAGAPPDRWRHTFPQPDAETFVQEQTALTG